MRGFSRNGRLVVLLIAFAFFSTPIILAQDAPAKSADVPNDVVAPSLKLMSKDEIKVLDEAYKNQKKRTKLAIDLMESRILKAEKLNTKSSYRDALDELGGFEAILNDTLNFLFKIDAGGRRFIDFEIYLRKQIPRLESIRREMPYKFAYHVGILMKNVRDARTKAVEPLFDDTVVAAHPKKP